MKNVSITLVLNEKLIWSSCLYGVKIRHFMSVEFVICLFMLNCESEVGVGLFGQSTFAKMQKKSVTI